MRRLSGQQGSVMIIVTLAMTTLMGMTALAIDLGAALVEQRALQNGADAAAIAIAKACAEHAVDPVANPTLCDDTTVLATAGSYFTNNSASSVTPNRQLVKSYGGKVGRITVTGSVSSQPLFARMLGISGPLPIAAAATARWGPLTAVDDAFPLAVCKGALPDPDTGEVTLVVDPATTGPPGVCDGADDEEPFGWIPPDTPSDCTSKVSLLPPTYMSVGPADTPPTGSNCTAQVAELFNDIAGFTFCHSWPWWLGYHCHSFSNPPAQRTRVLPVYDAAAGGSGSRPSYSLIAFEFTGARIGSQEAHRGSTEPCPSGMHCIRGIVRDFIPPTDGPIFDPAVAALLPNIDDTTVLDVRLVD